MTPENDEGYILRVHPLTETSLVVRWLTAANGRLATVARGARNPKSAFFGRLDLCFGATLSFQQSRRSDLHTLREVSVTATFPRVRSDYSRLSQAAYAVALVELVTETETPVADLFALFGEFLGHLESAPVQPRSVYALEARILAAGGLDPGEAALELEPGARALITGLRDGGWDSLNTLHPAPADIRAVSRLLESQLRDTWGRIPRGREAALSTKA